MGGPAKAEKERGRLWEPTVHLSFCLNGRGGGAGRSAPGTQELRGEGATGKGSMNPQGTGPGQESQRNRYRRARQDKGNPSWAESPEEAKDKGLDQVLGTLARSPPLVHQAAGESEW